LTAKQNTLTNRENEQGPLQSGDKVAMVDMNYKSRVDDLSKRYKNTLMMLGVAKKSIENSPDKNMQNLLIQINIAESKVKGHQEPTYDANTKQAVFIDNNKILLDSIDEATAHLIIKKEE